PYRPETVGETGIRLVLGRHSGRKAILHRLHELGKEPTEQVVQRVLQAIKELPKGELVDDDLLLKLTN
ncbi:MAG: pyruvate carboxyltransferase, partial [Planctomycetaceae bacterium]|nr:pyruvate carboxyltransferase [Planctomycetaceae bacterium]